MNMMVRLVMLLVPLLSASGCSELRVIGKATVRELTCDAINVERASYAFAGKKEAPQKTTLALASQAKNDAGQKRAAGERK